MIAGFFWWNYLQYILMAIVCVASFVLPFKIKFNTDEQLDAWYEGVAETMPKKEG